MKKIIVTDKWPEAISDGLVGRCKICGELPYIDYLVYDNFWKMVVPPQYKLDVVCLSCLDRLASKMGLDISENIECIHYTGINKTIVLLPKEVYYYNRRK